MTVSPTVTWPSPPMATLPSRRTQRMVVLWMVGSATRAILLGARMRLVIDLLESLDRRMSIHLRGGERGVPQKLLNGAKIGARIQQVRREGMPKRVHVELPAPGERREEVLDRELNDAGCDAFAALIQEHRPCIPTPPLPDVPTPHAKHGFTKRQVSP